MKASGDLDHVNLLEISHTGEHTSLRVENWRTYRVFARFFIAFSWFVKDFYRISKEYGFLKEIV